VDVSGTPAILHTRGNRDCHVILRGGKGAPNHTAPQVAQAREKLRSAGLPERLVIDASHDNSGKDHARQPGVVAEIAQQVAGGDAGIVGVMLESFLVEGRQDLAPGVALTYGQSVTDACMSWETTVGVLDALAAAVRARRAAS
jgi:3-deoxy-7-phosphoheptulonate synthase